MVKYSYDLHILSTLRVPLPYLLKPPSLFAAWLFWTFHTKSQNMKALVDIILCHFFFFLHSNVTTFFYSKKYILHSKSFMITISPPCLFIWNKWTFVCREYFLQNPPFILPMQITFPWPPVGSFSHGLITVRQTKMWT